MGWVGMDKFIYISFSSESQYHYLSQYEVLLERNGRTSKSGPTSSCGVKKDKISQQRGQSYKYTYIFLPFSLLQSVHNFTLPSWATEDAMTKLRELSELSLLSLYGIHKQKEKSRLQGGKY